MDFYRNFEKLVYILDLEQLFHHVNYGADVNYELFSKLDLVFFLSCLLKLRFRQYIFDNDLLWDASPHHIINFSVPIKQYVRSLPTTKI